MCLWRNTFCSTCFWRFLDETPWASLGIFWTHGWNVPEFESRYRDVHWQANNLPEISSGSVFILSATDPHFVLFWMGKWKDQEQIEMNHHFWGTLRVWVLNECSITMYRILSIFPKREDFRISWMISAVGSWKLSDGRHDSPSHVDAGW